MINTVTRLYNYFTIGEPDEYGQAQMPGADATPNGTIRMAIYITSQSTQDNINYKDCNYMGLTMGNVDDTYIIEFENARLKVLYVNTMGRYKQVFMKEI